MDLFGITIPLWAFFLIGLVIVVIAWKLIKFALTVFVILVIVFIIFIGLDYLHIFDMIQQFFSNFL